MATTTVETPGTEHKSTVRDRVVETLREAARLPREAHLPKSVQEAVEEARALDHARHHVGPAPRT